ncbi:hypothetical protein [Nocardia sp. N2S4-5]|uniref:hypothetical protein n=1 Tax=Nocardia sp. N2S4-5 TaxID=3351565 RepID=UPI0037CEA942
MVALDVEPTETGTVEVLNYQDCHVLSVPALGIARQERRPLYDRHACPDVWPDGRG